MTTRRGFFRLLGCGLLMPTMPVIFLPPRSAWPYTYISYAYVPGGLLVPEEFAEELWSGLQGKIVFNNPPLPNLVLSWEK